mmetsp:Transcript_16693/g.20070  ORF Transcript_16693/g.20070 Transcript_16693/m.20070 type:complete len:383 (+) Transcript_16693:187-1335(+)|eukprot:CAMPEP_0197843792 /NCGR_PEP_ID=MMETSP1438-20131217/732_1 /TAXON_ID=1461541 /ORGANISM="Pterosperma sp., Strain CCMP1384" /LENGTH=382 /DNA_ID=CAMNT_0043454175 /DNA_START=184 /DNA_END=1332 /DNA_ORIENTATION=+
MANRLLGLADRAVARDVLEHKCTVFRGKSIQQISTKLHNKIHPQRRLQLSTTCVQSIREDDGRSFNFIPYATVDRVAGVPSQVFRVAYQGVPGAYSEMAAMAAYSECEPVPCAQFEDCFSAVEQWNVDRAIVPVENTLGGSIHRNYDLLLRHRLHIVGEVQVAVDHCLLALPGVKKSDISRVLSHPQALAQCEDYLTGMGVVREAVADTAKAAADIAENQQLDRAALASSRAGSLYGLEVVEGGVQDEQNNITRFIALSRSPIAPPKDFPTKTSIVFALSEGPGVLFKALACFSLRGIDLTKIESRPMKWKPLRQESIIPSNTMDLEGCEWSRFQYLFYVDFIGSMAEENCQNALRNLEEMTTSLKLLGTYPRHIGEAVSTL